MQILNSFRWFPTRFVTFLMFSDRMFGVSDWDLGVWTGIWGLGLGFGGYLDIWEATLTFWEATLTFGRLPRHFGGYLDMKGGYLDML